QNTVVIFGAGATKACGGPQMNDILPDAYDPVLRAQIAQEGFNGVLQREGFVDLLDWYLSAGEAMSLKFCARGFRLTRISAIKPGTGKRGTFKPCSVLFANLNMKPG